MRRLAFSAVCSLALVAFLATGCTKELPPSARQDSGATGSQPASTSDVPEWIRSEAASLSTSSRVDLVPMEGAQAWLGQGDFAAFVDKVSDSEIVVDLGRRRVLSFVAPGGLDRPASELATQPGEPAREVILRGLDRWVAAHAKDLTDPALRRTINRIDHGQLLSYDALYQPYVDGIPVGPSASVNVMLDYSDWKPAYRLHRFPGKKPSTLDPAISMPVAIDIARQATGMREATLVAAEVKDWRGGLEWFIELDNAANVPPESMGNRGSAVTIDAMTGEATSRGGY